MVVSLAKKEGKFNEGFVDLTGNSMNIAGEPKPVFCDLTKDSRYLKYSEAYTFSNLMPCVLLFMLVCSPTTEAYFNF